MKTIHIIMQGKGGVGKTFISSIVAQYLKESTKIPVHCFDTDPVNKSFAQISALNVKIINILTEHRKIDGSQFDVLMDQIVKLEGQGVIDTGAASFVPLMHYLLENRIASFLSESGIGMIVHVPMQGGQALRDTGYGLSVMLDELKCPVVIWLNNHLAVIEKTPEAFKDRAIYKKYKKHIIGIVEIAERSHDTFGKDIRCMTEQNLTFEEVATSDKFFIMNKQRILIFKRSIYEQLNAIGFGDNHDTLVEKDSQT